MSGDKLSAVNVKKKKKAAHGDSLLAALPRIFFARSDITATIVVY